jgi:hypothetical protein
MVAHKMEGNGHASALAGHLMIFLPEQKYSKRTKR